MPKCLGSGKDFEIYVEYANGKRLNEHDLQLISRSESGTGSDRTGVWLECQQGKEFKIILTSLKPEKWVIGKNEVMATVNLDGQPAEYLMFHGKRITHVVDTINLQKRCRRTKRLRTVTQALAFGNIKTVEEAEEAELPVGSREANSVGTISVCFYYGTSTSATEEEDLSMPVLKSHGSMWEEEAKNRSMIKGGKSHPQQTKRLSKKEASIFKPRKPGVHFHEIKLEYTTRAGLVAMGILPSDEGTPEPARSSARTRSQRLPTISTPSSGRSSARRTPDSGLFSASPLRPSVPPRRSRQSTRATTTLEDGPSASTRSSVLTTASVAEAGRRDEILQALLAEMKDQNAESGTPSRLRPRRTDSPTLTEEVRRRKRQIVDQVREEKRMRLCTQVKAIDRQKRGKRSWQEIDSVFIDLTGDSGDEWEKEEKIEYPDEEEESEVELFEPERIMPRTTRRMARVVKTEQSF